MARAAYDRGQARRSDPHPPLRDPAYGAAIDDVLRILAVLALVGANAFFVIGEYAVVTARRSAVQARLDAGHPSAASALRLMDDPVRVISTVQVGITALGILTGAVGEPLVRAVLPDGLPAGIAFVLGFAVVTYLSVVLGELVPKALTLDRADRLATLVARPVELLAVVLSPVVWVLQRSAQVVLRPFGVREVVAGDAIRTPEELRAIVDEAEGAGVIGAAQEELISNVFDFSDRRAIDVMTPAVDVAWLDARLPVGDALDVVAGRPFRRYPVPGDGAGEVAGVVHLRDLLGRDGTVADAMRAPHVVPGAKPLGELMRELREHRRHLAVVLDEYGALAGIVTLEDILEELVGEIEDEHDLLAPPAEALPDGTWRAAGALTIDDFNDAAGSALPRRGPRTLGGLAFAALGRRPGVGDAVVVDGTRLEVTEVAGSRITGLLVEPAAAVKPGLTRA